MKDQPVFGFQQARESSGYLLWQVTNLWQREIKKALEPMGMTHSQFVVLASAFWLFSNHRETNQVNIASHAGMDPMNTSSVIRALEQKNLLTRKENSKDTRAKIILLTDGGRRVLSGAIKVVEDFDRLFFSVLKSEKDFQQGMLDLLAGMGK